MKDSIVQTIRLGDSINFPSIGEIVGVHYVLRNEAQIIESTHKWGKLFEWRVGSAAVLPQLDSAIRKISLGGKAKVVIVLEDSDIPESSTRLTYEIELLYIK